MLTSTQKELRKMTKTFDTSSTLKRPPAKNEVKDGQTRFAFHDGALYQYSKYNNELYAMKYFPHMSQMADVILNDETVVRAQHSFTGDPIFEPGLGSKGYQTGWTASGGTGYKIYKDGSEYHAEFDGLIVRGTMRVFELLLQQIRATNGSIFVTSAAKADAVTGSAGTETITFEDPNEETTGGVCPFIEDDIILSQRFNIGSTDVVTRKVRRVASVSGKSVTVASDVTGQPSTAADVIVAAGDDFVRVGSTTNAARRGGIYMSSDDPNSPFIVIFDGVTSWSDWTSNDKTKARLGRLDSIDDDTAGLDGNQTNEFGLYSDSVYLKGHINATSGKIGGVNMSGSTIYTGGGNYNNSDTGFYLSNAGNMSLKDKFTWDGSTLSVSGSITVTGGNAETTTGSQTKATAAQVAATAAAATDATSKADSAEDAAKAASLLRASYLTSNTTTINGGTITTGSIAADRIAANSITADQIDTANITAAVVTTESVNAKTITADAINMDTATISGTLEAANINASTLSAISANLGSITAGSISIGGTAAINSDGSASFTNVTVSGTLTSNSSSVLNSGKVGGFDSSGTGLSSSAVNVNTDGSVTLASGRFKFYTDGDMYFHMQESGAGATRRGPIFYDTADTSGNYWKLYHDHIDHDFSFLYNGSNRFQLSSGGLATFLDGVSFGNTTDHSFTYNNGHIVLNMGGHASDGSSLYPYDGASGTNNPPTDGYDLGKSTQYWRKLYVRQSNVGDLRMSNNIDADWTLREKPDCILARNSITQKTFMLNMTETSEYDSEVWDEA